MGETVTIPREFYLLLLHLSAEWEGTTTGSMLDRNDGPFHPGDPVGTILAEASAVADHGHYDRLVVARLYMQALRTECDRREISAPSVEDFIAHLPWAVNSARYPELDVKQLQAQLRAELAASLAD